MSEDRISVRFFAATFEVLENRGISPASVLVNVPYDQAWFSDPNQTIEWAHLCVFCDNLGKLLIDEELRELGAACLKKPSVRILYLFSRLTLTVRELYDWLFGNEGLLG